MICLDCRKYIDADAGESWSEVVYASTCNIVAQMYGANYISVCEHCADTYDILQEQGEITVITHIEMRKL